MTIFKGLKHLKIELSIPASFAVAGLIGAAVAFIGYLLIKRVKVDEGGG